MPLLLRIVLVAFVLLLTPGMVSSALAQALSFRNILDRSDRPAPDHKFAYGKDANQYAELWLPAGKGPYPVVVLIHGGCWMASLPGPELVAFLADDLRKHGVAVWSVTYRRLGHDGGGYPGTFLDIANGVDKVREVAEKYSLDLNRVVAAGHSAGGHFALWAAARPKIADDSALKMARPLAIHAVIGIAAIPDLQVASESRTGCPSDVIAQLVDAGKRNKIAWDDTSPAALLPLGVKQTLVSGVYDAIVPPAYAWRYQVRAQARNEAVDIVSLDHAGHFEIISPWTPPGREVVNRILDAFKEKP
jgi:acetyl esterase/lipase